ncbi:patatin-like phospholipase family protein [Bradyrhizobium sp. LjRoot220]|uniref:patatin-like phospholipase family protein n=1 Tax=Bradyrhizobium sp. LjRoot220 TaxID=3342284 RepID=UPI003ECC4E1E
MQPSNKMLTNTSIPRLLGERARTGSVRGKRLDANHIALVIECGGMRGIVAGGFLKVLCEHGMVDAFDSVHGASAGACAAAYFLSNQPEAGSLIFKEDICTREIVSPFRVFSYPAMVDTDFIVDEVINKVRALNDKAILGVRGLLHVVTSEVESGQAIVHDSFATRAELLQALKASLRVPGLREPGIKINGTRHLDGGLLSPIPLFSAIKAGATHILVLATQTEPHYGPTGMTTVVEANVLGWKYGRQFGNAYAVANRNCRLSVDHPGVVLRSDVVMRRGAATECSWYTIDRAVLVRAEAEAIQAAEEYLTADR